MIVEYDPIIEGWKTPEQFLTDENERLGKNISSQATIYNKINKEIDKPGSTNIDVLLVKAGTKKPLRFLRQKEG